jgi:predicted PurR-regulated permease PerM
VRIVFAIVGAAVALYSLWLLSNLFFLAFGAALLATVLRAIADFFERRIHIRGAAAYACAIVSVAGFLAGAAWLLGAQLSSQADALAERVPTSLNALQAWLHHRAWLSGLVQASGSQFSQLAARVGSLALTGIDVAVGVLLVIFGGIYFGAEPRLYRDGAVAVLPRAQQPRAARALELGAYAMRRWLLSQLVDMVIVGLLTGIGLWLVGVPSPLALGLITGLSSFVPYIGAFMAGFFAVLIAFGEGPQLALWALAVYIVVQLIEGHLIVPFVQRWAIAVPPALVLFAVAGMGYLFGPLGLLFAAPLVVVLYVLVRDFVQGADNR